MILVTSY